MKACVILGYSVDVRDEDEKPASLLLTAADCQSSDRMEQRNQGCGSTSPRKRLYLIAALRC